MTEIEEIGYSIKSNEKVELGNFINQNFPGFDLLKLLQVVEDAFTQVSSTPIQRMLEIDTNKRSLKIAYGNLFKNEDEALLFVRTFTVENNEIHIYHDYCVLPKTHQGKGLIKIVFQESFRQYISMGAKKIHVHAGLSGGGYAWAKYGFRVINDIEVINILIEAHKQLSQSQFTNVQEVYQNFTDGNNSNKGFPIRIWAMMDYMKPVLMGSDWHGELDLTNPKELNNFKSYVFSK